ncbi:hypothetical protein [Photorhabdus stackebrandtii]|uniref:Uncharacterized protein n=1 Tax=Photorhabdus stackebrandtii TaxID=1123042 RepID=A0A7X5QNF1_9GAMM|nr:hypothetical protein [Photorhabdus stackebrandtii]NHB97536.1 hypothetical protein [Photorhabdus stackebrandtii]
MIEAGFFLAALIRFAGHPRLGGHHHHNCGLVETEWDVEKWNEGDISPRVVGCIVLSQNGVKINGEELEKWNNAKTPDFTVY